MACTGVEVALVGSVVVDMVELGFEMAADESDFRVVGKFEEFGLGDCLTLFCLLVVDDR